MRCINHIGNKSIIISLIMMIALQSTLITDSYSGTRSEINDISLQIETKDEYYPGETVRVNYSHSKGCKLSEMIVNDPNNAEILRRNVTLGRNPYSSDTSTVGMWHFNETTGSQANDSSPNGNHGNINGATRVVSYFENSLSFSGTDYVSIADTSSLDINGPSLTLEAWVNPDDPGSDGRMIIDKEESFELMIGSTTQLRWAIMTTTHTWSWVNTGIYITPGVWTYIALVYDGLDVNIYINGKLESSHDYNYGNIRPSNYPVGIGGGYKYSGGWAWRNLFLGEIDEVRISDTARTSAEIENAYTASGKEFSVDTNTKALWHFNNKVGNDLVDETNNDNDGTIVGASRIAGMFGSGLKFDGSGDYVNVPDSVSLDITTDLTIESWVLVESHDKANRMIVDKEESYEIMLDGSGYIRWGIMTVQKDWSWYSTGIQVPLNEWTYIALTYNGSEVNLYINGENKYNQDYPYGNVKQSNYPLGIGGAYKYLGSWKWDYFFKGTIDEVRISDVCRSQSEIIQYSRSKDYVEFKLDDDATEGMYTIQFDYFYDPSTAPSTTFLVVAPYERPSSPTNVRLSSGDSYTHIHWSPPDSDGGAPVLSYRIYRGISESALTLINAVQGDTNEFNDTGLINGNVYYYGVSAYNVAGESPRSDALMSIPMTVPDPPEGIRVTSGDSFVDLKWDQPTDNGGAIIDGYEIFRKEEFGFFEKVMNSGGAEKRFNDTDVQNGIIYYYKLRSWNMVGFSEFTDVVTTTPMTTPDPPYDLKGTIGDNFVDLEWTQPSDDGGSTITNTVIYRKAGDNDYVILRTFPNQATSEFNDTNVMNGIEYSYYITVINLKGESVGSNVIIVTPMRVPDPVSGFEIQAGDGFVELIWREPSENGGDPIISYDLFRIDNQSEPALISEIDPRQTSYYDTTVSNGVSYDYYIYARNNVGRSRISDTLTAYPMTIPDSPSLLGIVSGNGFAEIRWKDPDFNGGSPIIKFLVYRGESENDLMYYGETAGDKGTFNDTNAMNGIRYYYGISAVNIVGESEISQIFNAIPKTIPGKPMDVSIQYGDSFVLLFWKEPLDNGGSSVTGYQVYRRTTNELDFMLYAFIDAGTNEFNDTEVTNGEIYQYKISATNEVGSGVMSNMLTGEPASARERSTPSLLIIFGSIALVIVIVIILMVFLIMSRRTKEAKMEESVESPTVVVPNANNRLLNPPPGISSTLQQLPPSYQPGQSGADQLNAGTLKNDQLPPLKPPESTKGYTDSVKNSTSISNETLNLINNGALSQNRVRNVVPDQTVMGNNANIQGTPATPETVTESYQYIPPSGKNN